IRLESYGLSSIFTLAFFPFSCCTAPHADSSLPTRRSSDLALLTTIDQARRPVLLVHRNLPEKRTHGYPLLTSGELIDLCVHTPCQVCLVRVVPDVPTPLNNFPHVAGKCLNALTFVVVEQSEVSGRGFVSVENWRNIKEPAEGTWVEDLHVAGVDVADPHQGTLEPLDDMVTVSQRDFVADFVFMHLFSKSVRSPMRSGGGCRTRVVVAT